MNNRYERKPFGGIPVTSVDLERRDSDILLLGEKPYEYRWMRLRPRQSMHVDGPARYCVYILNTAGGGVQINNCHVSMDSYMLGDASHLEMTSVDSEAQILLASQSVDSCRADMALLSVREAKKVEKPWGHEIWLTGDPSKIFAFKRILLRAGNRTSLQYHRSKRETNFILSGSAMLHFSPDTAIPAGQVKPEMVERIRLDGPIVADVFPGFVHRLEAITDMLLYEVSTPELDDVIRIHDETGRSHGRIHQEHA